MGGLHDEQLLQGSRELLPSPDRILGAGQTGFTIDRSDRFAFSEALAERICQGLARRNGIEENRREFGLRAIDTPTGYNLHVK
jgi:hypothetical protein